jgi:hypothetical protein
MPLKTIATCGISPIYFCNINMIQLQHTSKTSEIIETYIGDRESLTRGAPWPLDPRALGAPSAGAGARAHAGAAAWVVPIPASELRPGVAGRRRGRGSPRVVAWIRARARASDAATPEQEEGDGGSKARGSCDARGGRGGARLGRGALWRGCGKCKDTAVGEGAQEE